MYLKRPELHQICDNYRDNKRTPMITKNTVTRQFAKMNTKIIFAALSLLMKAFCPGSSSASYLEKTLNPLQKPQGNHIFEYRYYT